MIVIGTDGIWEMPNSAGEQFGKLLSGTRRHNLISIDDLTAAVEPDGLRLNFTLPAGSYATMLLHEVMKVDRLDADGVE